MSNKLTRHRAYRTGTLTIPPKTIYEEHLFIPTYYDSWREATDGQRNKFRDFKRIKKAVHYISHPFWLTSGINDVVKKRREMNAKQKRLLRIRKAKKTIRTGETL